MRPNNNNNNQQYCMNTEERSRSRYGGFIEDECDVVHRFGDGSLDGARRGVDVCVCNFVNYLHHFLSAYCACDV